MGEVDACSCWLGNMSKITIVKRFYLYRQEKSEMIQGTIVYKIVVLQITVCIQDL